MVPLARALAKRDHDVQWAVAPEVRGRVEAAGFRTFPAGIDVGTRQAEYARRYPEAMSLPPAERPDHMFPVIFGEISAPLMVADLLPVMDDWKPALVVNDASEFAGPLLAARAGVPHATHGFGALLPAPRVSAASAAVSELWRAHGLEPRPYAGSYDHLYLDIYPPSLRPGQSDHVGRSQPLRPVPFDAVDDDRAGPTLDPQRPLVYVTFGTLFNDPSGVFTAAVAGVSRLDVDVLVTVGPNGDPAALGPVRANVRVERYVPQTQVLPRCAAVVSHAGSGTFLATLGLGIPQLCLPQAADQFLNARQGAAAGAALTLLTGEVSADAVADATRRLLSHGSFAQTAGRLGDEIAAMPSPDNVAALLEALG